MSLILELGTKPDGLEVKTFGFGSMENMVYLGDYEISLEDFLLTAEYVLTSTPLTADDPRLQFVKCVPSMREETIRAIGNEQKHLIASVPSVVHRP